MGQKQRQSGFSLPTTIFLMVVLALLGVSMTSLVTSQQQRSVQSIQTVRAGYAASAGFEWGVWSVTNNLACFSHDVGKDYKVLDDEENISLFEIRVSCDEDADVYEITSLAVFKNSSHGNVDYIQRRVYGRVAM